MRAKRKESKLAQWFSAYLISSTFSLALTSALLVLGLLLNQRVPLEIALGTFTFFHTVLMVLYLEAALRTRSLRKMLFYPILDIVRGVAFTIGGLTQLIREYKGSNAGLSAEGPLPQEPQWWLRPSSAFKKKGRREEEILGLIPGGRSHRR